jgi:hypothetical protein
MSKSDGQIEPQRLQGFKYFQLIDDLCSRLHDHATQRDKAGNRKLFFDQYAVLLLLYYFNPAVTTLRGVQQFTSLEKVQRLCGVKPTSLGSLSEAARVFDPQALEPILAELAARASRSSQSLPPAKEAALAGLIAVDGSLLRALPRMAWAVWQDATHRAAKMHVAFAVFPQVPVSVTVTTGNGAERPQWRQLAEPGGFYVADRGYADYDLFRELDERGCRFVVRLQENAVYEVERENPLSAADRAAGVVLDVTLKRLGTEKHNSLLKQPLRVVRVQGPRPDDQWVLATNAHALSAELVAIAYHHRWQIELFFRWLKCVLGCRHLLAENQAGVNIQVYLAMIASLLIGLWVGTKPNRRTYEMLCHYLSGWATLAELDRHLLKLQNKTGPPSKS